MRPLVDAFHVAAIADGAKDDGAPGLRPHHCPDSYGEFVFEPDGRDIEAVSHDPES